MPLICTIVITGPLVGVKLVSDSPGEAAGGRGAGRRRWRWRRRGGGELPVTVKFDALTPVPAFVVTEIGPVVEPAATRASSFVDDWTIHGEASLPLNLTDWTFVNPEPLTVTTVFTGPLVGWKLETAGPFGGGGGGGGGGGEPPGFVYSRRFGEPVPGLLTTPAVALPVIAALTCAGVADGLLWR